MSHNGKTVLETISLTKKFKDFWGRDKVIAVDDLNIQIRKGEVFGLLGPNGSGKTTTIKMLLGLLHPTHGRSMIFEKSPQDVEVKSRIGYLPEETRLYQFLNSWETLDFYGRLFKIDSAERTRRSDALIEMIGLGPASERPVGQYSKGMARRIGLAQSLINDPDLLILDEPTSGMDPIGTRQIKDLLLELKKRGKTILLSSHLLADVEDVCDRVVIMYGGKLLCCGPIDELLAQHELTQILIDRLDSTQMNELEGYLRDNFHSGTISVSPPKQRLEQFFLSQIEKAQAQMETSGALAGGKVSEFLRAVDEDSGEELLEKLSVSDEQETPAVETVETAEPNKEQKSVIDDLIAETEEQKEKANDALPLTESDAKESPKEVDKNLLDTLTEDNRNSEGG